MKWKIRIMIACLSVITLTGCSGTKKQQTIEEGTEIVTEEVAKEEEESESIQEFTYADTLFDTSYVHEINVQIEDEDWEDLLANPTEKTKYEVNVTIDGEQVKDVSFATKGNTSLSQVASMDSDRYSFKINFGKYIDDQTYKGLDKLNLNNTYSDTTYLKDYISYRIMAETQVAAPLVSFVSLSVNGEVYGLYVAVEEVGDSFLARNFGETAGELYKPETSKLNNLAFEGEGERPDLSAVGGGMPPTQGQPEDNGDNPRPSDMGMPGGFDDSANGADLVYTDDEISSYSDIFDNAETKIEDEDMKRVISALRQMATGNDLETCIDIEAVTRYFVAHNFVINYDSYTGNMLHNYYLYEKEGVLSIFPWDYNLAFGGFAENSDFSKAVNWPIDTPLSDNIELEKRPLWSQLAANDSYMEQYHNIFENLINNYFESGRFEQEIDDLYTMIRPYVESDPTAFYTLAEFDKGVETLKSFCLLRAESVRAQLEGTLAATAQGQEADQSSLISVGQQTLDDMGVMKMKRDENGEERPNQEGNQGEAFSDRGQKPKD